MEELRAVLELVRELGSLGLLALLLWLLFKSGLFRRNGGGGPPAGALIAAVALAVDAYGQAPANVVRPFDGITATSSWPDTADRIECESTGWATPLRVATIPPPPGLAPATATFPLQFPALEVRCRACNAAGCSELSPNALEIHERARADCDANGVVNVSDVVCVGVAIYRGGGG